MRIEVVICAGGSVVAGLAIMMGQFTAEAVRTFAEIPPSAYVAAGLIPAMFAGQLLTLRKRSRR